MPEVVLREVLLELQIHDLERDVGASPACEEQVGRCDAKAGARAVAQAGRKLVTAERAMQKEGFDVFELTTLQADITTADGTWLSVTADKGEYSRSDRTLVLQGVIDIYSNVGYEMHATHAVVGFCFCLVPVNCLSSAR